MEEEKRVGFVYDIRMCNHSKPGDESLENEELKHIERPERLSSTHLILENEGILGRCRNIEPKFATEDDLARVHGQEYINSIKRAMDLSAEQMKELNDKLDDDSVYLNNFSMEAARLAAGSLLEICKSIVRGDIDSGFAFIRPPGHHAEHDRAKGFCIFNNIAIAAHYLLNNVPGMSKILIVDWDIHHGNGTQHLFFDDNRVLYFSIHRYDNAKFYPESKDANYNRIGSGPGEGYNINVPLSRKAGCGDADYLAVWDQILLPVVELFKPDMILISAGFDAAKNDRVGRYHVSPAGFGQMLEKLKPFAEGKIVLALEGGYNLTSLLDCVRECIKVLLGEKVTFVRNGGVSKETKSTIKRVRRELQNYWEIPQQKFGSELRFSMKRKVHVSPTKQPSSATKSGNSGRRGHVSSERRSSVGSTPGKKRVSKSKKAGLTFPVGRVTRFLKKGSPRLGRTAAVYLTAVLECVAAEVLEKAGNQARSRKKVRILPSDILHCTRMDEEFVKLLADRVIPSAGNFPPRRLESLPKRPTDLASRRNSPRR